MYVDRCVCHRVPFKLLDQIVENEYDVEKESVEEIHEALSKRTKCSTGCGMCKPYILRMIETGQTSFVPFPPNQR
ncbi:MAG: bacterioferritin-associated ferredoxin [Phycisphaerales bacterium]